MKQPISIEYSPSGWYPRADLYRCPDGWLIKFELAGVPEQEVSIQVDVDQIIVEGRRRDWTAAYISRSVLMEITYDWFRRRIELPARVDPESLRTEYRDGMLLIHLDDSVPANG